MALRETIISQNCNKGKMAQFKKEVCWHFLLSCLSYCLESLYVSGEQKSNSILIELFKNGNLAKSQK